MDIDLSQRASSNSNKIFGVPCRSSKNVREDSGRLDQEIGKQLRSANVKKSQYKKLYWDFFTQLKSCEFFIYINYWKVYQNIHFICYQKIYQITLKEDFYGTRSKSNTRKRSKHTR